MSRFTRRLYHRTLTGYDCRHCRHLGEAHYSRHFKRRRLACYCPNSGGYSRKAAGGTVKQGGAGARGKSGARSRDTFVTFRGLPKTWCIDFQEGAPRLSQKVIAALEAESGFSPDDLKGGNGAGAAATMPKRGALAARTSDGHLSNVATGPEGTFPESGRQSSRKVALWITNKVAVRI